MTHRWTIFIVLVLSLTTSGLAGPLSFTFTSSLLTASRGQTVTFSATLMNSGATSLFLNSDVVNITAPLIVDDTKFFLNTPVFLTANQSVTVPILDVIAPVNAPFGLYPGNFVVLGGSTANDLTNIGSANFAVNVVPEPGTIALFVGGGLLLLRGLLKRCRPG
jgi:hypothetical protein